ncbi:MAG: hypothetical protein L6Q99_21935 [Planctomycetes bacterium]|nr:hypothetical protein [Planctomycetota bacterium]
MKRILLSAAFLPVSFVGGESPGAPPLVWRTYDLAPLAPCEVVESSEQSLLPLLVPRDDFSESNDGGRGRACDWLAEVAFLPVAAELEREGRSWQATSDGKLAVYASPDAQALLERELGFFGATFAAAVRVRVDVIDDEVGSDAAERTWPTRLPAAAADELVQRAAARGRVRSALLTIAPGDEVRVDDTRELRVITDYEVEVAQHSAAYDPVESAYRVGTELHARAAAVADGVQLALVARHSAELGPVRERKFAYVARYATEKGVTESVDELVFQAPQIVQHTEALTTFLPRGEAVLLRSAYTNLRTNTRCTFVLRGLGEPTPVASGLELYGNGQRIDVVDLSRFAPPYVRLSGALLEPDAIRRKLSGFFDTNRWEWSLPIAASPVQPDDELELARQMHVAERDGLFVSRLGAWCVLQPSSLEPDGRAKPNLDAAALTPTRPKSVELDVRLRRGDVELARWGASVVEGRAAAFTVGAETLGIDGANMEIAQGAAIHDPLTSVFFDGVLVEVVPRRSPSGAVDLDVVARARVLDAEPEWATGRIGGTPPVDRASWGTLIVDERVGLPATGEPRTAVLGLSGAGGLVLEVGAR